MKVWITKHALTIGIYQVEVNECFNISKSMVVQPADLEKGTFQQCFHKNEWFKSKDDAIANAEERRIKKLKSLDKQIKKVSNLKFE